METTETAPPVVAVVVVHEPGESFGEVLDALARQDYPSLRHLFLVSGDPGTVHEQIRRKLPAAFIRTLDGDPGYGAAANEVLHLVEGDNGFFCLLHDDVALEPGAIRLLVEELYRSNAGIVGPKLVDWDEPRLLQHVGLGVDRFGEIDPLVEPGEVDQEQHDAVRDVFALPSACLLVRADLFRTLEGFDPAVRFYGDDIDLCWRAHLGGARVVVVPSARGRHRERLPDRRPDLRVGAMQARHRMRAVATLTGAARLPWVLLQLVIVTLAELVVGLVTARPRQALNSLQALVGMVPRIPAIVRRRRHIAALRHVPSSEVAGLQVRGSARLASYLRSRDRRPLAPEASTERRWRQTAGSAPAIAWVVVLVLTVIGARHLITDGVPTLGQFVPYPDSPSDLLDAFRSGWSTHGLGATIAAPTGMALVAVGSVGTLFHMGLWHTVAVVGLLVVGYAGMWRLCSLFPQARARIVGMVVYAALPLPSELLSIGRWGALACYAATPWIVHLLRRAAGLESSGLVRTAEEERVVDPGWRVRARLVAQLALLVAITIAFVPSFAIIVAGVGVLLAAATLLGGGSWKPALAMFVAAVVALVIAWLVNLPWSSTLVGKGAWTAIVGVPPVGTHSVGIVRLARFGVGRGSVGVLALALYVPVAVAPLVCRGWRFTWAVRAAGLAIGFGFLVVLDDRGSLFARMPEPGVLLAPVAVGVALAAACIVAAFQDDVVGGSFGWRQPLGILTAIAIVIGIIPGVAAIGSGRYRMPQLTLADALTQLPGKPSDGDARILWIGDPRLVPVEPWAYAPGIGYAVSDAQGIRLEDGWAGIPSDTEHDVTAAIDAIRSETTLRAGRLLAPYGIRYIIVPVVDGARSTIDDPLPVPAGLLDALNDQLDLGTPPLTSPLDFVVYENTAWTPVRSELTPAGAAASQNGGAEAIAATDLSGSTPFGPGASLQGPVSGPVQAGTVHVAVPFDSRWQLSVGGTDVAARPAFGTTMGYDVAAAGEATLTYDSPTSRSLLLAVQVVLWLALLVVASRFSPSTWRRWRGSGRAAAGGPVVTMHAPIVQPGGVADPLWGDDLEPTEPSTAADQAQAWDEPWDDDPWPELS